MWLHLWCRLFPKSLLMALISSIDNQEHPQWVSQIPFVTLADKAVMRVILVAQYQGKSALVRHEKGSVHYPNQLGTKPSTSKTIARIINHHR